MRGHLGRRCHPARQVRLEGPLVVIAFPVGLARCFVHDVGWLACEEDLRGAEDPIDSLLPSLLAVGLSSSLAHPSHKKDIWSSAESGLNG